MSITNAIRSFLTSGTTTVLPSERNNITDATHPRNLRVAVDLGEQSLSIFASLTREQAYKIIRLTGAEAGVRKIHELITNNAEAIFWTFALVNLWQNWMMFCAGAVTGLAMGTFGSRIGIVAESVQILKTQDSVAGYNYLSAGMLAVLAPWLISFQGGIVAANYLLHPAIIEEAALQTVAPELEEEQPPAVQGNLKTQLEKDKTTSLKSVDDDEPLSAPEHDGTLAAKLSSLEDPSVHIDS